MTKTITKMVILSGEKYEIHNEECIECGSCASVCPVEAPTQM